MSKQTEIAFLEEKRKDCFLVDPRNIEVVENFNVREDYGDMDWLIKNVADYGVKIPLRAYKKSGTDKYILTDGHRRLMAAMAVVESGTPIRVPIVCEPKGYSEQERLCDMFSLNEGKQLNAIEQSKIVSRLLAMNLTAKEISDRIQKSQSYVSKLNSLYHAPKELKDLITQGKISSSLVIEILGKEKDLSKVIQTIKAIIKNQPAGEADADNKQVSSEANIEGLLDEKDETENENDEVTQVRTEPARITAQTIKQAQNKVFNPLKELKYFFREIDNSKGDEETEMKIKAEYVELVNFMRSFMDGDFTKESLIKMFIA